MHQRLGTKSTNFNYTNWLPNDVEKPPEKIFDLEISFPCPFLLQNFATTFFRSLKNATRTTVTQIRMNQNVYCLWLIPCNAWSGKKQLQTGTFYTFVWTCSLLIHMKHIETGTDYFIAYENIPPPVFSNEFSPSWSSSWTFLLTD